MSQRPGAVVVDASVAIKWYLPEPGSDASTALLTGEHELIAPDLLVAELGNVVWKRERAGQLTRDEAEEIGHALASALPVALHSAQLLIEGALVIAGTFHRTVYDSLYLALAVATQSPLITADQRFYNALRETALEPVVYLLEHHP